jgi:hypothetical protein
MIFRLQRSDNGEERCVDPVRSGRQDSQLPSFLAAVKQKLARILKVVAFNHSRQDPLRWNRRAVRRDDQRNLSLRHRNHWRFDDAVLPTPKTKMQSGASVSAW